MPHRAWRLIVTTEDDRVLCDLAITNSPSKTATRVPIHSGAAIGSRLH